MKINIYPTDENYGGEYITRCIKPASENIPEWYKTSHSYIGDLKDKTRLHERMTMKKCIPILDLLSSGINLYLPFTIFVEGKYPERVVYCNNSENIPASISHHDEQQVQNFPLPKSFDRHPYKINFPYVIETPKGYSSLYIQPQNELYDKLFFPRALVNTDNYSNQVNFPFFVAKDFEGTIEAETHFLTVMFVKREKEEIIYNSYNSGKEKILAGAALVQSWGRGFYKKNRFN